MSHYFCHFFLLKTVFMMRRTFVLFLHAKRCPLELGFNVMINWWREKTTRTELYQISEPNRYIKTRQIYFSQPNDLLMFCASSKCSHLCFVVHPFCCSPSGPVFLYLPARFPSTCQRLLLTAAAVANNLFRRAGPEWELRAAEPRLRNLHNAAAPG